jgi:tetratricopeptide (TPR) repeat protein
MDFAKTIFTSHFFWLCIYFLPFQAWTQTPPELEKKVDSLTNAYSLAKHDTTRINVLLDWAKIIRRSDHEQYQSLLNRADSLADAHLNRKKEDPDKTIFLRKKSRILNAKGDVLRDKGEFDKALDFYNEAQIVNKKSGDKGDMASTFNNIGIVYGMQAEYETCEAWMMKSLDIYKQLNDANGMANAYNNLGNIHYYQGDYKPAINFWTQSLKMKEKSGDKLGMANTLNNIGNIHKAQNDDTTAISYYQRSLKLYEEIDHTNGMGVTTSNLAGIYLDMGQTRKAFEMYSQCLKVGLENEDKKGISDAYNGLGLVYKSQNNLDSSKAYFLKSLSIRESIGDTKGTSETNNHLAKVWLAMGNTKEAMQCAEKSMQLAKEMNSLSHIKNAAESLWKIHKKNGNSTKALEMHELFVDMRDSLESEENRMAIIRNEFEYAYEKQMAKDSIIAAEANKIKDAELYAKNLESRQRKLQNYILLGILGVTLILIAIIFHRFRVTKTQKGIIEHQKQQVDQAYGILAIKNREITDSINYAKRIQYAILPAHKRVKECLNDSFILFQPKDIVAGDFYWLEERDGKILFAACDCTGHGVPGAMVSVICVNGLNRAVRENGLTEPAKILDKTREIVISEFEKSDDEVKDGMDVSLCSLSLKDMSLQWSGANNPLWIFRKETLQIEEIKPDKQTIAKVEHPKSFTTHQVKVNKGDIVYLFTDGFKDQFGGPKGKKFKASNLKKLLVSLHEESMETQKTRINEAFENWKGNLEQVDDVCIVGVRIG